MSGVFSAFQFLRFFSLSSFREPRAVSLCSRSNLAEGRNGSEQDKPASVNFTTEEISQVSDKINRSNSPVWFRLYAIRAG